MAAGVYVVIGFVTVMFAALSFVSLDTRKN